MFKMEKKKAVMKNMETAEVGKKLIQKKKKTPVVEKKSKPKIGFHIPGDVVTEILLRLPARSLGKFRCVSKSWLSITSNTSFVKANTQHNLITRPSLITCNRMIEPMKSYLASVGVTSKSVIRFNPMKNMPENCYVMASCDGLVCVRRYDDYSWQHYVSNPLTGQSIALPLDLVNLSPDLGFYFHRSTSKYRLIRFDIPTHESQVLVVGENSWRRIPDSLPAFFHSECPLDLSGKLYWLARTRSEPALVLLPDIIVIFDEEEEVYSVICPPPSKKLQKYLGGNLVNFNGKLGLWIAGLNFTIDLWVMESFWIKRYSVNYAHILKCPSLFRAKDQLWIQGGAISIGDEELLVDLSTFIGPHYLVRWNLKSGACVLRHLADQPSTCNSTFPYTKTLTSPH